MNQRLPSILVALYLFGCIIFGGSSQNPWTNLGLQIAGIGLIAWAAIGGSGQGARRTLAVNVLLICALLLILIQLIPLPADLWTKLPERAPVANALSLLGYPLGPAPISLMPYRSILTLFAAIPGIAVFLFTERFAPSPLAIASAIVGGTVAAVFVGALQVASGPQSTAYFYDIHSPGAIGFFANGNHMATLLLAAIPMAAALVFSRNSIRRMSSLARYGLAGVFLMFILVGVVLNGSRAAIGLLLPVTIATVSMLPAAVRWRGPALAASILSLIAGVALILGNPITSEEFTPDAPPSATTRGEIWTTATQAIYDNFPVGTGLGTFQNVYHLYERPDQVSREYVNHAHNEYLELAIELGAGGILLMALFLGWWIITTVRIWKSISSSQFTKAATVVTGAILAHSLVDFPLRTGAISAIFGACVGLMGHCLTQVAVPEPGEPRPTRHVKLG